MNRRQILTGTIATTAIVALPLPVRANPDFHYVCVSSPRPFVVRAMRLFVETTATDKYAIVEHGSILNVAFADQYDEERFKFIWQNNLVDGDPTRMLFARWNTPTAA